MFHKFISRGSLMNSFVSQITYKHIYVPYIIMER